MTSKDYLKECPPSSELPSVVPRKSECTGWKSFFDRCWFHKWHKIKSQITRYFMGEKYIDEYCDIRRCLKCGIVQKFEWDSQGGSWRTLSEKEQAIFERKTPPSNDWRDLPEKAQEEL